MGTRASGRRPIPAEKSAQALRLLDAGWTPAATARAVGVSRETVRKLAAGQHCSQRRGGQLVRCRQCGILLKALPCLGCSHDA